jgi:hypothetical protein
MIREPCVTSVAPAYGFCYRPADETYFPAIIPLAQRGALTPLPAAHLITAAGDRAQVAERSLCARQRHKAGKTVHIEASLSRKEPRGCAAAAGVILIANKK